MLAPGLVANDRHSNGPWDRSWCAVPVGLGVIVHRRRGRIGRRGNHLGRWCVIGGSCRSTIVRRADFRRVIRRCRGVVGSGRCIVRRGRRVVTGSCWSVIRSRRSIIRGDDRAIYNRCGRTRHNNWLKFGSKTKESPANGNVANRRRWGYGRVNLRFNRLSGKQWSQRDGTHNQQLLEHDDPPWVWISCFCFGNKEQRIKHCSLARTRDKANPVPISQQIRILHQFRTRLVAYPSG